MHAADGPVAIDPWPSVGDPAFDVALYLAWRDHDRPLMAEWRSVSSPRVDAWTWALSVLERNPKDPQQDERRQLVELLRPAGTTGRKLTHGILV